jgi:hypothetical protein
MERERTLFYGFLIGLGLTIIPIPRFFFWKDIMEHVTAFFRYGGFIFAIACALPLVLNILKNMRRKY